MDQVAILGLPWREAAAAARLFADEPHALLLYSGAQGWSYLMRAPVQVAALRGDDPADPFEVLARGLGPPLPGRADGPPFQGGWAGLASYELAARVEPVDLPRHPDWPDLVCGLYPALLAFDGPGRRLLAIGRGTSADEAQARAEAAARWLTAPAGGRPARGPLADSFEAADGAAYEAQVAEVVGRIAAGEIFQANIARTWRGRLAAQRTPFDLFERLASQSPAPFAAYYRLPGSAVVSNSPERFLALEASGAATTQPIKGTRPRGTDPEQDAALAQALLADPKDRAENLMIVDLMRNDLSRVCVPGQVRVPELFRLRSFTNVHHLVSTVTGQLKPGLGPADLLRAAFPPGSITGAPKVQAMKVIAALEGPRGPYCGALFWAGLDGAMESSVLIRTVQCVQDEGGWRIEAGAGAGLVADSIPAQERAETEAKIAAIRAALLQPWPESAEAEIVP
jgi:para-aminobenzoate synthetase component 1